MWPIASRQSRGIDHVAQPVQASLKGSNCPKLNNHIPQRSPLHRPGHNGKARRIRRKLAQQGILGTATHNMNDLNSLPTQSAKLSYRLPVGNNEGFCHRSQDTRDTTRR